MVTWSTDSAISSATEKTKFAITDTKLYVPIVTLSTQDNSQWQYKYLSKCSLIEHTCSWCDKLIVLWKLNGQAKTFSHIIQNYLKN